MTFLCFQLTGFKETALSKALTNALDDNILYIFYRKDRDINYSLFHPLIGDDPPLCQGVGSETGLYISFPGQTLTTGC